MSQQTHLKTTLREDFFLVFPMWWMFPNNLFDCHYDSDLNEAPAPEIVQNVREKGFSWSLLARFSSSSGLLVSLLTEFLSMREVVSSLEVSLSFLVSPSFCLCSSLFLSPFSTWVAFRVAVVFVLLLSPVLQFSSLFLESSKPVYLLFFLGLLRNIICTSFIVIFIVIVLCVSELRVKFYRHV